MKKSIWYNLWSREFGWRVGWETKPDDVVTVFQVNALTIYGLEFA